MNMATLQEVRRAIYYAERFVTKHYHEFNWGAKTYGVIKEDPAIPLTITMNTKPTPPYGWADFTNRNWLSTGWAKEYGRIPGVMGPTWYSDVAVETITRTFELWEGRITFQYWFQAKAHPSYIISTPICTLYVKYYPNPTDPTRMRLEITPESAILGLGLSLWLNFTQTQGGTKCILSSMSDTDIGRTLIYDTEPYGCFPSNEYATRYSNHMFTLYGWFDSPALRSKVSKVKLLLDDYGFDPKYYTNGSAYRTTDALTDDYPWTQTGFYQDCPAWDAGLPAGVGFHPHWSRSCFDVYLTCTMGEGTKRYEAWASHWMNKYKDPDKSFLWGHVAWTFNPCYTTARTIIKGHSCYVSTEQVFQALAGAEYRSDYPETCLSWKDWFHPGLGFSGLFGEPAGPSYQGTSMMFGYMMLGIIELGYGFGDAEAKTLADQIIDVLIKAQWGYKAIQGLAPSSELPYDYCYSADGPVKACRPDFTGSFKPTWTPQTVDGETVLAFGSPSLPPPSLWTKKGMEALIENIAAELLNINSLPEDIYQYAPSSMEWTLFPLIALRAYEFYKWRLPR
jgi:hypothetical protein